MKRIWINYELWEDHKKGMYSRVKQSDSVKEQVVQLLKKQHLFFELGRQTITLWPNSMSHNLSYVKSNRRSYLRQAVSCFMYGSNIKTTTEAWDELSVEEKNKANFIADLLIEYYENEVCVQNINEGPDEKLS